MNEFAIYDMLGNLDEDVILDALPPSFAAVTPAKISRSKGRLDGFLSSPVAAAVLSGVVAIGILIAIVLAGRQDPSQPIVSPTESEESTVETETISTTSEETHSDDPLLGDDMMKDVSSIFYSSLHLYNEMREHALSINPNVEYPDISESPLQST